jgi:hypothetical protein
MIILSASTDADIDVAFEAFIQQRVQALLIGPGVTSIVISVVLTLILRLFS